MTKCYAQVVHLIKHMNMVGGPFWWGGRAPCPPPKSGAGWYAALFLVLNGINYYVCVV